MGEEGNLLNIHRREIGHTKVLERKAGFFCFCEIILLLLRNYFSDHSSLKLAFSLMYFLCPEKHGNVSDHFNFLNFNFHENMILLCGGRYRLQYRYRTVSEQLQHQTLSPLRRTTVDIKI